MQETIKEVKYTLRLPWHTILEPDKTSTVTNNLWEIEKQLLPYPLAGRKNGSLVKSCTKEISMIIENILN